MGWNVNDLGHLDLSCCLMKRNYDMFEIEKLAREYYFAELTGLVAWDGLEVKGMDDERKFLHLVCRHGHGDPPLNPLMGIDLRRVECLPILKAAVAGGLPVDVYRQESKRGLVGKVEVVVEGVETNYVVVLSCLKGRYVIRSAYPASEAYVEKVKRCGALVERIRPASEGEQGQGQRKAPDIGHRGKPGPEL